MNTISNDRNFQGLNWSALVMFALGFWLSASLLLDAVIIPSLSAAGMMNQEGFASAGYLLFGIFNRLELICAALILTGFLAFGRHHSLSQLHQGWSIALATLLLVIPLIYTYILTPQMSSLALSLNLIDTTEVMSPTMISMHGGYWVLEVVKFLAGATLLRWCYRDSCDLV
jgi:hypothetical protein